MERIFSKTQVRLVVASVIIALLIAFIFLIPRNPGAFRAVPVQTSLLLEFNGVVSAAQSMQAIKQTDWKKISGAPIFENIWREIAATERVFHHNSDLKTAFAKSTLLAALALHPADSLHPLFILETKRAKDLDKVLETSQLDLKYFPYQFHGQTLYTIHTSPTDLIVVALVNKLLIFSRYSYLVEDGISQLENTRGWWADNQYLRDLQPDAPFHLYFRPEKWEAQQSGLLTVPARRMVHTLSENLAWAGIAWDGKQIQAIGEAKGFLGEMGAWQGSTTRNVSEFLPDNTAYAAWAGFNDRQVFCRKLAGEQSNDFNHFILPWLGKNAMLVVTEPLSAGLEDDRLLFFEVGDSTRAQAELEAYGEMRGLVAKERIGMFEIFGFQNGSLLQPLFDQEETAFQNPYCVHLGRQVVFAPNRPSLEVFIEKYIGNQTLMQNVDFLQLQQNLPEKSRGMVALNGGYLVKTLDAMFQKANQPRNWAEVVGRLEKTGWMAASMEPGMGRKLSFNLLSQPQTIKNPASDMLWRMPLAAPAITPVYVIEQPGMEEGAAILLQDRQSKLYCIKPDGSLAWQKHLGDIVISPIKGIDFYQNGRNCYIFNTKKQIWIIDEHGKEVQGYPLKLQSPAAGSMTLVDFDRNQRYCYFIGCENGHVYGFDLLGRALPGWNPQTDAGLVATPMLHFQNQGKDYVAMTNNQSTLYVFDREGKQRFSPIKLPENLTNAPFLVKAGTPAILCIGQKGAVTLTRLDGRTTALSRLFESPGSEPVKAIAMEGSNGTAIAALQGKQLAVVSLSGNNLKKVLTKQFHEKQDEITAFPGGGLGLCSRGKRKAILINAAGAMAPGFPIAGTNLFAFGKKNHEPIIVGVNGSSVYAIRQE